MPLTRLLDRIANAGSLLVLPLALLLFLQWPLRDAVGAGSRPANDMAQWLFALYVAVALRHATRWRTHIAADTLAARYPLHVRRAIERFGHALAVLPFALFVLASAAPVAWNALRTLEAFPDTLNPGYFIVKLSAWLLALLMALQALAELFTPASGDTPTA
ncbi:MAG TPA: TRAP transporter small permease subunit [Albitalea sp.]|nr:TRAP transporter small permease subunit [Albitalea sp.]